jgi:phytoene desaturase
MAHKGYCVQVFESNTYPGGKLSEFKHNGYRFDAGPSLFTQPELVDELFTLCGKNPRDYFKYHRLETLCHYFYPDGTMLHAHANREKWLQELTEVLQVNPALVEQHLKQSEYIYQHTAHLFLEKSLHKLRSYLNLATLRSMLALPFLGIFNSMNKANEAALQHPKLVQLFNRYATYNGSNPYECPAILNIIPHLEFSRGAYYPEGGMIRITEALYALACELGVEFTFGSRVEEIITQRNRVTGVRLGGKEWPADTVICNMDVAMVYKHLLPNKKKEQEILSQERSSSALIFYWGIHRSFPELDLHNIFFSKQYEKEFQHIFEKKTLYEDPTVYVNITSKFTKEDAPANHENWFVMINVPSNTGQDWDQLIAAARTNIQQKLSAMLGVSMQDHIVSEEILDPRSIESRTASYQGSLYGSSSNHRMAAFFRHSNFSSEYPNLYFCGGSVHPGGGIPLALSSAKIIDSFISKA